MDHTYATRYSIRDVSQETGVPAHTLRFWEKALDPLFRPYRTPGGQRRYDDSHVTVIREVRRRVTDEHQSLAAVRRELLRQQEAETSGRELGNDLLADPIVQQALDDVASAVKQRVMRLLEHGRQETGTPAALTPMPPHGVDA